MEQNRKYGSITVMASILLALASVVFSENPCYAGTPGANSWFDIIFLCLRINIYEENSGSLVGERTYLLTKYLLLACATLFAVGILWYAGALSTPRKKDDKRQPEQP